MAPGSRAVLLARPPFSRVVYRRKKSIRAAAIRHDVDGKIYHGKHLRVRLDPRNATALIDLVFTKNTRIPVRPYRPGGAADSRSMVALPLLGETRPQRTSTLDGLAALFTVRPDRDMIACEIYENAILHVFAALRRDCSY